MEINNEIIIANAINSSPEYIYMKAIEEMSELSKELCHSITKPTGFYNQLQKDKIIEETGDVLFRLYVLIEHLNIVEEVQNRFNFKQQNSEKYVNVK